MLPVMCFQYFSEIAQNPESNLTSASTCNSSASSSVSASPYLGRSANLEDSAAPPDHVYAVPALVRQSEQVTRCRSILWN